LINAFLDLNVSYFSVAMTLHIDILYDDTQHKELFITLGKSKGQHKQHST